MKPSTRRILTILGSFALILGSLFVYLSFVVPTYREIQTLKAEQQAAQEQLRQQREAEITLGKLVGEFSALGDFQQKVSLSLPKKADIPDILNQLSGIASLSAITLQSLSFQYLPLEQSRNPFIRPVGVVRVSMSLFGSYEGLKAFVAGLETNKRVIDLTTLKVDGGARVNQTNLIHNIVADIYYQS